MPQPKTFFFTDRAIYRPGQTIYFKGITLLEKDKGWSVQDGRKTTVTLFDVNRRKVSELELFTNEFGSFSGSFTSPSGVLNGEISISNGSGSITVSVEEYKRPRFEVKLEKPDGMYRLNTIVNVKGKAGTYSGSPVDGARVTYRVTRTARFPYWYDERGIIPSSPAMEICNGTITTDEKGEFVIPFTAIADPALSKDKQPVFNFEVRADVMDINGESQHGSTSCSVGYTSMVIETNLPGEISKDVSDTVQMKTTNLSGRPVNTRGLVKVFRLRQPEQVFKPRKWSRPDKFILSRDAFSKLFPTDLYDDEDNVTKWEKQQKTLEKSFDTSHDSVLILDDLGHWETGRYVFEITATDAFGEAVVYTRYFSVYSVKDKKVPGNVYSWFSIPQKKFEPGQTATVLFGSQVKGIHVLFEVLRDKLVVSRKWLDINKELIEIPIPVTESDRGNLGVNFILTKNNNSFQSSGVINVPRSDKELNVSIGTFRDKLMPGEDEEWQVRVSGKKGDKVAAELLISMVDASLEAIKPNRWNFSLFGLNWNFPSWQNQSAFALETSEIFYRFSLSSGTYYETYYQGYDKLIRRNPYQGRAYYNAPLMSQDRGEGAPMVKRMEAIPGDQPRVAGDMKIAKNAAVTRESGENLPTDTTEIPGAVNPRTNLRETAFFFPDLKTNENGELVVKFRVPESLTRWKVTGLAHTKDLRSGTLVKELVTSKELMVFPNFPRFLREGDKLMFSVKIVSLSKLPLKGKVNLQFFDALTMKPIDNELDNKEITLPFYLEAGQSTSVSWPISVPFGLQAVTYNLKAWTSQFSDGEEASLPVLSNRILVTEALTLPVKGKGKFDFEMKKLTGQQKGPSSTLKNHSLSLEFTSNPAWLAVQALPYLMDQTYDCSELIFNRFYANAMATWISNSNPEIHKVFERWSMFSPSALLSNLEKNRELKTVSLEETPWIVDASNESESKKRIALLFDLNRMVSEKQISLNRLQTLQTPNGGWSWFPGMPDDRYITQYIVSGLGHLSHLGILDMKKDLSVKEMMRKAVLYLDERLTEEYRRLLQYAPKTMGDNNLSNNIIQYLYARSFFTDQFVIGEESKEAVQYYKGQAAKYWTTQSPYLQGMIALGLSRMGDSGTPGEIIRSLKERAIHHPELGMYWKGSTPGYYWHQSGIGTQSLLIEAFDEIAKDQRSVEEMKIWLLKQKQTNHWNSTISTADACYALLLRGTGLLSRKQAPVIQLGRVLLDPDNDPALTMESGTGYFKTSWHDAEIQPDMGKVSITNKEEGIAWGALYWQYFENLDKITPVNGPLTVERQLFIIKDSPSGPVMEAVSDKNRIKTGDKIKVRILLSCDRDLEYVHLKDLRAAGLEPAEVLSGYRYESGLGYYKSTGDAASHYFFSFLPKGTHIFEYTLVASVKGAFSQGISTVECMYAPDFSAHTEGLQIKIE
ncbi:MAG: MG2 domain-containing protein [Bacteroidetes bacterium]|nr:MG2 domain-containing protein [Bacteroidota bacterium]